MQNVFLIRRVSNIIGHNDHTYVLAENKEEALKIGLPRLNAIVPAWCEQYCKYYIEEAI